MQVLKLRLLSALEKVFPDEAPRAEALTAVSGFQGETVSFQAAVFLRADAAARASAEVDAGPCAVRVRRVEMVPVRGTAFTPEQAALVHYVTTTVAWCPDPDEAGANALLKGASVARSAGLDVYVGTLVIPDAVEVEIKDPDDLMAMGIPVRYEYCTLVEWMYHRITYDKVKTIEEARRVASEVVPMIQAHPLPAVQLVEMRQLADLSGIPESSLARPKATDLARVQEAAKPPERLPIDMSLPPERLLYAAILQQGFRFDWRPYIPWIDLSAPQWGVLSNIGHILDVSAMFRISVADAIGVAGRPELRDYLMYWLSVREGREADIAALAATVARENRRQASMYYARQGNYQYAEYLNNN